MRLPSWVGSARGELLGTEAAVGGRGQERKQRLDKPGGSGRERHSAPWGAGLAGTLV